MDPLTCLLLHLLLRLWLHPPVFVQGSQQQHKGMELEEEEQQNSTTSNSSIQAPLLLPRENLGCLCMIQARMQAKTHRVMSQTLKHVIWPRDRTSAARNCHKRTDDGVRCEGAAAACTRTAAALCGLWLRAML